MFHHDPSCLQGPVSLVLKHPVSLIVCRRERANSSFRRNRKPAYRADLVARIRREIAAGTYETPEKLQAACDAMILRNWK